MKNTISIIWYYLYSIFPEQNKCSSKAAQMNALKKKAFKEFNKCLQVQWIFIKHDLDVSSAAACNSQEWKKTSDSLWSHCLSVRKKNTKTSTIHYLLCCWKMLVWLVWKKLRFPVCLHYSLINRTSHYILVSMFSCKLAINKSRLCLCVRINRCSGSGERTG